MSSDYSQLQSRVSRGAAWSFVGTIISRGFALIGSIIVARILGKAAFGELGIIQSTVGMLQVFGGAGLGLVATKYIAELRDSDPTRAGRIIGLTLITASTAAAVMAVSMILAADWLAANVLAAEKLEAALRPAGLLVLFGAIAAAQTGVLSGYEAFRQITLINTLTGVATLPLMTLGAYYGGVAGSTLGNAVALAISCVCNFVVINKLNAKHGVRVTYRESRKELAVLSRMGVPAVAATALVAPVTWASNALLVQTPGGYDEMGVFNAANQWRSAVLYLPTALTTALLPVLSSVAGRSGWAEFHRLVRTNLVLTVGASILVAGGVALFGAFIMGTYGPGFTEGVDVLSLLMLSTVVAAAPGVLGQALASSDRIWAAAILNGLWALVLLLSTVQLASYGAVGLASAYLIAYGAHLVTTSAYVWYTRRV